MVTLTWICRGWPWLWSETPATCCSRRCTGPWLRRSTCPNGGDRGLVMLVCVCDKWKFFNEEKEVVRVSWCCRRRSTHPRSEGMAQTSRPRCSYGWPSPSLKVKHTPALTRAELNWMKLIWNKNEIKSDSLISSFLSPSSGPMKSWKSSGQLTITTSPTLAACQQVRLSHIHGHTEDERNAPISIFAVIKVIKWHWH